MASQHPSWKAPPVSQAPAPPPTGWRYSSAPPPPPRRLRWGRLVAAFGLLLLTTTFLIWLLLWLVPPGPAVLLVVQAGYEDNLVVPQNAPGRHAAARLADLARTSEPLSILFNRSGRLRLAAEPVTLSRGTDWTRSIDRVREKTVIVYFAAHGGADSEGAYLLPHDATAEMD